jgi:drug/metabolite transporter (DMT)-like permease
VVGAGEERIGAEDAADEGRIGAEEWESQAARGRWMILAAATLWGTSATLARFVFRDHQVPALTVVELRLLIASLLLWPWLALRNPSALAIAASDWPYFVVLGLLGVAAIQGTYYYSIARLGVGLSILLQYLAPALIVLYEMARGRAPGARTLVAVAAAVGGTALLVGGVDAGALRARPLDWAAGFGSAVAFAFYIVYSKRGLARYRPETVLLYTFAIAGLFWSVITPPWRIARAGYGADLWLLFIAIGIGSTLLPFALFYAGLRRLRAERAAILATLEPVVAVVSAAAFLGEGLGVFQWSGAVLVLLAALLASRRAGEAAHAAERV